MSLNEECSNQFRGLKTTSISDANIILSSVDFDLGCSCGSGAKEAPSVIRGLSSFLPPLSMDGDDLTDCKIYDIGSLNKDINPKRSIEFHNAIKDRIAPYIKSNKLNIILGGDHSISIGPEQAFYDYAMSVGKIPVIIHLDAHPDICDFYDGSYYSHASPIRRAIDYGYKTENIVLIGIRGYEKQETIYLNNHKEIKVYKASFLNNDNYALSEVIERFKDNNHLIYLSYDVDINDPSFAPGTGTPEAFGLSNRNVLKIIKSLVKHLDVKVFDIVEVSPKLDVNNITSWLVLKMLYEIFSTLIKKGKLWNTLL